MIIDAAKLIGVVHRGSEIKKNMAITAWLLGRYIYIFLFGFFSVQSSYCSVLRLRIFFFSSIMPVGLEGLQILCRLFIVTLRFSSFGRVQDFGTAFLLGLVYAFGIIFDVFLKKGER